jgi:RimJ/RimL family protein N-acetyltransferase
MGAGVAAAGIAHNEVGCLLSPQHWGQGYATEATRTSLQFGFERIVLDHHIALVYPEKLALRRVIRKRRDDLS